MAKDAFLDYADSPTAPSRLCITIDPHDSNPLPCLTKAIYVGQGGDLALVPVSNQGAIVFHNVPTGMIIDVRARAVLATGTTADQLVGLC